MSAEEEVREHEEEEEATTTTTEVEVRVRRTTSTANKEGGLMHLDARARACVCVHALATYDEAHREGCTPRSGRSGGFKTTTMTATAGRLRRADGDVEGE